MYVSGLDGKESMEIKQEVTELSSDPYSDSYLVKSEVNHVYQPNVITKLKDEVIPTSTSSITANTKWSPGRWQDATRKSAFQPYKSSKCTVLTNLQRGNTQTETPIPQDSDINFHTRAGQGEITVHDIKNEPSVDIVDSNGLTALQWAAAYGQMTAIIRLIANGAKVNYVGQDGETSLLLAAAGGHHDVVRILLNEGALVNHTDHLGNTALMYAAYGDHPHSCNELLLRGADITISNDAGDSAYSLAVENNSKLAQAVIENYMLTLLSN